MRDEVVLARGSIERIGDKNSLVEYVNIKEEEFSIERQITTHSEGIQLLIGFFSDKKYGVIKNINKINAIGHRLAHGGERYDEAVLITEEVMKYIKSLKTLAPLHIPFMVRGIEVCQEILPDIPQAAVFDTAFHQTMPRRAYMYGLPYQYYNDYGIRRYGFHGSSHRYVAERAAKLIGSPLNRLKLITCHLGNGASIAAIDKGESVDTSMGFTPLEGIIMGTRCGDIDPAIIPFLMRHENLSEKEIDNILNEESGLLGLSGISNDMRDIETAAKKRKEKAQIAVEVFNYKVIKYIGAYTAVMGSVDAIIFTGGIGENGVNIRKEILKELSFLDIELEEEANKTRGKEVEISKENSSVKIFVIPTDEEIVIARDTKKLLLK